MTAWGTRKVLRKLANVFLIAGVGIHVIHALHGSHEPREEVGEHGTMPSWRTSRGRWGG